MRKSVRWIILMLIAIAATTAMPGWSQRRVTPVTQSTNTTLRPRKGEKLLPVNFNDSLYQDSLRLDSIKRIYPKYPVVTDVTVGVNVFDPLMRLFGQKYGLVDFSVALSMWNRLFPVVEFGVGNASDTPEGKNYHYKTPLSFYGKVGANYNFMFKNTRDYQFLAGLRLGYSSFSYDVTAFGATDGYWEPEQSGVTIHQKSHAMWAELLLGLRVKLFGNVSAGWFLKYNNKFSLKDGPSGQAWYIPGYGTRNTGLNCSFSIYYTIPIKKHKWPKVDSEGHLIKEGAESVPEVKTINPSGI